ncbi:contractile injection system protein, VgrG/Pvc8 family [Paraburkholderia aspalathi]|uniref:contractile injection system protein, VgrG/Pvc8 family n=1 Tax=Paraburkholderia aspalathi TaxID=1324617 RepID=UPI001BAC0A55|nr:contractile injection system protein, VgrG/Pvc8 family [Paraburkholderia aspalathi]
MQTLVLLCDPMTLPKSSAGTVRYNRDAVTEARDSIGLLSASRQHVPGDVLRASWDYKNVTVAQGVGDEHRRSGRSRRRHRAAATRRGHRRARAGS